MGWASGSELFYEVIKVIQEHVDNDQVRQDLYIGLIHAFENYDCDTLDEVLGEDVAFDNAWEIVHGDDFDEDEDY